MTNDYLFRAFTQEDEMALRGLLSAVLHVPESEIITLEVVNPIVLGDAVEDKEFILDVKIFMNNNKVIDMELQVVDYHDWPERSLQYLCRVFDSLKHGQKYLETIAAVHIGILDYELFPGESILLDSFRMTSTKTGRRYSDYLQIYILSLPKRNEPSEEDIAFHTDLWAGFFKAKTWEDLKMLAQKDENIAAAVDTAYKLMSDDRIRERVFAREDYYRRQKAQEEWYNRAKKAEKEATKRADDATKRADDATKRADDATKRADDEAKRADDEAKRADEAEAKLKRYEELLLKNGIHPDII